MKFDTLDIDERLLEGIDAIGFTDMTPVQEQVIPVILEGRDVIASAQTGTGKTAAFLLPVIHKLLTDDHDESKINCIIIVPTVNWHYKSSRHWMGCLTLQISAVLQYMVAVMDLHLPMKKMH